MYTVLRYYHGHPELADELARRRSEIEAVIRQVPGFISYQLIGAPAATVSVTTCESQAGCDETSRRAAEFLRQHAAEIKAVAPQELGGDVKVEFRGGKPALA